MFGFCSAYELEAFAKVFDVDTSEVTDFLNNMMEMASRLMYKSNRTPEENMSLKMLHVDMERFRINMLKFISDAIGEMAYDMSDEVILKYDDVFVIESLEYGGR